MDAQKKLHHKVTMSLPFNMGENVGPHQRPKIHISFMVVPMGAQMMALVGIGSQRFIR